MTDQHQHAAAATHGEEGESKLPYLVLLCMFIIGVGLTVAAEAHYLEAHKTWKRLIEHASSAFIVAAIIGVTYERLAHKSRDDRLFRNQDRNWRMMLDALEKVVRLSPHKIFALIKDIAEQSHRIPTLYKPARDEADEYTFARSHEYFKSFLLIERDKIIEELRRWIAADNCNLRFLASDFVGEFRLEELADDLDTQVKLAFTEWRAGKQREGVAVRTYRVGALEFCDEFWDEVEAYVNTRSWVLNYVWASSRCEAKAYRSLEELLLATRNEWVQRWILFVPEQMQDKRLCEVMASYLRVRDDRRDDAAATPAARETLRQAVRALSRLRAARFMTVKTLFIKHCRLFNDPELLKEIRAQWPGQNKNRLITDIEACARRS